PPHPPSLHDALPISAPARPVPAAHAAAFDALVTDAYAEAQREAVTAIATTLQSTLGQKLTAFAVRMRDPKAVGRYATGRQEPRRSEEHTSDSSHQII